MAPTARACIQLLEKIAINDAVSIAELKKLASDYALGMRFSDDKDIVHKVLVNNGFASFLGTSETSDVIVKKWHAGLGDSKDAQLVKGNADLTAIFMSLVEFVKRPDSDKYTGDPATMKTSKAWFSPRPFCTGPTRVFSATTHLKTRPTPKQLNFVGGVPVMTGGGSQNERKNISYVNNMRYLDSLNNYYNMVGGDVQPTNCCNDLQKMYENITNNLQSHGKQVETSDNRIIETMLNKFSELESKVVQIQENISKLSAVPGANVSGVLRAEKEKLKTESKYLSTQGKSLTSVLRSLFESSNQVPDNNKALTNARLQFPQHTVGY